LKKIHDARSEDAETLRRLLPPELFWKVVEAFKGSRLYIPVKYVFEVRNKEIMEAAELGTPSSILARRYGITKQSVNLIIKRFKPSAETTSD